MKVVAFNGSPKAKGNTYQSLKIVTDKLENEGINTEIIHVGKELLRGCMACNGCLRTQDEKCSVKDDKVNEWIQVMKDADGIILGSPVHFAAMGATMKAFLDRAFYVSGMNGNLLRHKVGASVVAVRRSGGVPTFDQLNNYLVYAEMLLASSNYWNVAHGTLPGEIEKDAEGVQIMEVLGRNMAWSLKLVENGKGVVEPPKQVKKTFTSFVRR